MANHAGSQLIMIKHSDVYFSEVTPQEYLDFGKEIFRKYTLRHKVRLWLGISGQMPDGMYLFRIVPEGWWWLHKLIDKLVRLIPNDYGF